MGFFSDISNVLDPVGGLLRGERKDRAGQSVDDARQAQELKRVQFDQLREDAQPLRELRNQNINRLLRLQGIFPTQPQATTASPFPNGFELVNMGNGEMGLVPRTTHLANAEQGEGGLVEFGAADQSEFYSSPEFETVRDAALRVKGTNPNMNRALAERANELAVGEFGNYHNRIFNQAGFSSSGLANTNKLLQQNVDAQANLLNNAGAQVASNLIGESNQRGQAAGSIVGALGAMFCDARLKKNARKVGEYHSGIGKYRWEWTDEAKDLVGNQPEEGPMAHEVYEKMPENITIRGEYLAIKDMRLVNGY